MLHNIVNLNNVISVFVLLWTSLTPIIYLRIQKFLRYNPSYLVYKMAYVILIVFLVINPLTIYCMNSDGEQDHLEIFKELSAKWGTPSEDLKFADFKVPEPSNDKFYVKGPWPTDYTKLKQSLGTESLMIYHKSYKSVTDIAPIATQELKDYNSLLAQAVTYLKELESSDPITRRIVANFGQRFNEGMSSRKLLDAAVNARSVPVKEAMAAYKVIDDYLSLLLRSYEYGGYRVPAQPSWVGDFPRVPAKTTFWNHPGFAPAVTAGALVVIGTGLGFLAKTVLGL